jgi:hypothetical protein
VRGRFALFNSVRGRFGIIQLVIRTTIKKGKGAVGRGCLLRLHNPARNRPGQAAGHVLSLRVPVSTCHWENLMAFAPLLPSKGHSNEVVLKFALQTAFSFSSAHSAEAVHVAVAWLRFARFDLLVVE